MLQPTVKLDKWDIVQEDDLGHLDDWDQLLHSSLLLLLLVGWFPVLNCKPGPSVVCCGCRRHGREWMRC